jgi:MAF protein
MEKIILASNSPRRRELFALFGFPFDVIPADVDEEQLIGEPPAEYVERLARHKADVVASRREGLVIAADTIVVDGDQLLGKPKTGIEARAMLEQLRSGTHQVYTGIALIRTETDQTYDDVCRTDVPMRDYSDDEVAAYIATGDPMDKAGAYAIQHAGFDPVDGLAGCYASVMGLPLCHLAVGLGKFGLDIPPDLPQRCQATLDYVCPVFEQILAKSQAK